MTGILEPIPAGHGKDPSRLQLLLPVGQELSAETVLELIARLDVDERQRLIDKLSQKMLPSRLNTTGLYYQFISLINDRERVMCQFQYTDAFERHRTLYLASWYIEVLPKPEALRLITFVQKQIRTGRPWQETLEYLADPKARRSRQRRTRRNAQVR